MTIVFFDSFLLFLFIRIADEHLLYIRGRKLCAMDAFWQTMGYHTYPMSTPSVQLVKAKMPWYLAKVEADNQLCDLMVYFDRRDSESEMVFTKFFEEWDYKYNAPK